MKKRNHGINLSWITKNSHTFSKFLLFLNTRLVIFCETPTLIQRAHTPHTVCSYILPHGALSSGHPVMTHTYTSTHITETKPYVTTARHVMLVFESKYARLYFFLFIYHNSSLLGDWNFGAQLEEEKLCRGPRNLEIHPLTVHLQSICGYISKPRPVCLPKP